MPKKKKFYAVSRGKRPGVYDSWFGPNGAEVQVRNYPGARYKGFRTREEAEAFVSRPGRPSESSGKSETQEPARRIGEKLVEPSVDRWVLYTDGGALGNPGPGGYGGVLLTPGKREEFSGGYRNTTNNRMELMGCIVGLQRIPRGKTAVLYTDSRYVVDAVEKGWARSWRKKNWMRTRSEPAKNTDLWKRLLELCDERLVQFRWVKGHAGHAENERCDELVRAAAQSPDLPPDVGYERAGDSTAEV
ncbi:MAG: ribonuclease HI [Desulfobacteraceae bacterium]|nr:ribonuclease HI [Desulfobacteraceae bacterium]